MSVQPAGEHAQPRRADLGAARELVRLALEQVDALDGVSVEETGGRKSRAAGEVNRDLNALADRLALAAALVRNQQHFLKGFADPVSHPTPPTTE